MKIPALSILLLAGGVLIAGCAKSGDSPDTMITEAKALDQRFTEAYNNGDVDAIMATYWNSPDLVSYPPGALELKGFEAIRQSMMK